MTRSLFFNALALLLFTSNCLAQDIYLRLKPEVEAVLPTVRLGDVAVITQGTRTPALEQKLAGVVVANFGDTPSKILTRQNIEETLSRSYPALQGGIVWGGADQIVIRGGVRSINLTKKIDQLAYQIIRMLGPHTGTVELTLVSPQLDKLEVPAIAKIDEVLAIEKTTWSSNEVRVPIQIFMNGQKYTETMVKFRWRVQQGQQRISQEVAHKTSKPGAANSPLDPAVSLQPQMVENVKFLIQKGQRVHLIMHDGDIDIESEGIAISNANIDDLVKVRRESSSDLFVGRVSGPSTVIVGSDVDA